MCGTGWGPGTIHAQRDRGRSWHRCDEEDGRFLLPGRLSGGGGLGGGGTSYRAQRSRRESEQPVFCFSTVESYLRPPVGLKVTPPGEGAGDGQGWGGGGYGDKRGRGRGGRKKPGSYPEGAPLPRQAGSPRPARGLLSAWARRLLQKEKPGLSHLGWQKTL